jgi:hypothetical protein
MSEFEDYSDLFKWNRCLMEDDWNDGKQYVLKIKNKGPQGTEFATSFKVGEEKDGKHKLAAEEKLKFKHPECGGMEWEVKLKNDGSCSWELENNSL